MVVTVFNDLSMEGQHSFGRMWSVIVNIVTYQYNYEWKHVFTIFTS